MAKTTSQEITQKEATIKWVADSLGDTLIKYNKKRLELSYNFAVSHFSDGTPFSPQLIRECLESLYVRGIINIKKRHGQDKMIEYELSKNIEKIRIVDVDKYFEEVKKAEIEK